MTKLQVYPPTPSGVKEMFEDFKITEPVLEEYVLILKSHAEPSQDQEYHTKARSKEEAVSKLQDELALDFNIIWRNTDLSSKYYG